MTTYSAQEIVTITEQQALADPIAAEQIMKTGVRWYRLCSRDSGTGVDVAWDSVNPYSNPPTTPAGSWGTVNVLTSWDEIE
jgi:hypothetical protein